MAFGEGLFTDPPETIVTVTFEPCGEPAKFAVTPEVEFGGTNIDLSSVAGLSYEADGSSRNIPIPGANKAGFGAVLVLTLSGNLESMKVGVGLDACFGASSKTQLCGADLPDVAFTACIVCDSNTNPFPVMVFSQRVSFSNVCSGRRSRRSTTTVTSNAESVRRAARINYHVETTQAGVHEQAQAMTTAEFASAVTTAATDLGSGVSAEASDITTISGITGLVQPSSSSSDDNMALIIGCAAGGGVLLLIIIAVVVWYYYCRKDTAEELPVKHPATDPNPDPKAGVKQEGFDPQEIEQKQAARCKQEIEALEQKIAQGGSFNPDSTCMTANRSCC